MSDTAENAADVVELPRAQERVAVLALALAAFALGLNTNVLGALLPFLPEPLLPGPQAKTWLLAAAAAGSALGALAVGPATARRGRRSVLVYGLGAFIAFSAAHPFAGALWAFALLRFLAGFAVGLAYAAASALVAEVSPYSRRGAAMGRFTAGMFFAVAVGMPASVALARLGAWSAIFLVQALAAALGLLCALRAVPAGAPVDVRGSTRRALGNAGVRAGLFATMLHVGSFFTSVQLAAAWLDATGRVAKDDQIWLWFGLGLASVVGSAAFGRISDRLGKRRFVLVTSVVLAALFVSLATEPGGAVLLAIGVLLAVTASARTGPLQALVSGLVPVEQLAALMGLRGCIMQVGVVVFALAAGPVESRAGFGGVLGLAASFQVLSWLAIQAWVKEAG